MSGAVSYASGLAAEDQVARHYERSGHRIDRRRWRGRAGEIDLICRDGDTVVFIEVKRASSHARAAERVSPRQIRRLMTAAAEFLGGEPLGARTDARFDVALVDGTGRIDVLTNAFM
ncbi:YraN family protein [Maribius pontilimi]|uniref:UPF0102 protein ILP92_11485 n=1 Tax=Palleronia pontilimi TaxID=1964209 RepID=A0A934MA91_9RHOB|nr:YraN family protein [Palleronia pontilimi]MBJ3763367.1 YraN family protein [Palleronia pontilimi]